MKSKLVMAAMAAVMCGSAAMPVAALAQDYRDGCYYRHHHRYHGNGGYYRQRCGGGNGAVGTVAGGVGGALIGSAVGGGVLGTVAGGVGGGLLGRHLDKVHTRHRNGC